MLKFGGKSGKKTKFMKESAFSLFFTSSKADVMPLEESNRNAP